MKHDVMATANSAALVTVAVYVVCRLAFLVVPDLAIFVAQSWFHGITISTLAFPDVTVMSFVVGLLTAGAGAWLVGYLFAWVYNWLVKR